MQSQKSSQSSQSGFHSSKCTSGRNKSLMQIMMCTSLIWRKKPSTNNSFTQHHRPSVHVSTRPAACVHGLNHKRLKWRDCWTVSYAQISPRHQILWTSITQPLHDIYSHWCVRSFAFALALQTMLSADTQHCGYTPEYLKKELFSRELIHLTKLIYYNYYLIFCYFIVSLFISVSCHCHVILLPNEWGHIVFFCRGVVKTCWLS